MEIRLIHQVLIVVNVFLTNFLLLWQGLVLRLRELRLVELCLGDGTNHSDFVLEVVIKLYFQLVNRLSHKLDLVLGLGGGGLHLRVQSLQEALSLPDEVMLSVFLLQHLKSNVVGVNGVRLESLHLVVELFYPCLCLQQDGLRPVSDLLELLFYLGEVGLKDFNCSLFLSLNLRDQVLEGVLHLLFETLLSLFKLIKQLLCFRFISKILFG